MAQQAAQGTKAAPASVSAAADAVHAPPGYVAMRARPAFAWLGNPAAYAIGAVLLTAVSAGTTVLAPRLLQPAEFGAFALLTSLFAYAGQSDLGLSQLADRRIVGNPDAAGEALAIMQARWIVGLVGLAALLPTAVTIALFGGGLPALDTGLALLGGFAAMVANGPVTLFRAASRIWDFTLTAFVLHAGMTAPRLAGLVAGGVTGCFAALAAWYVACVVLIARPSQPLRARPPILPLLRAALPLFAFNGLWLLYLTGNRWISTLLSTPHELGLFSFGAALATVGLSLLAMMSQLRYPTVMARAGTDGPVAASALVEREVLGVSLGLCGIGVAAIVLAPTLIALAFPGYEEAAGATVALAVACLPLGAIAWTIPMLIMRSASPLRDAILLFGPALVALAAAMTAGDALGGITGQAWANAAVALPLLAALLAAMGRARLVTGRAAARIAVLHAIALSALAAAAALASARADPARTAVEAAGAWPITFEERFDALSLVGPANGVWEPHYPWGGRTNATNRELQYYVDPRPGADVPALQALGPLSIEGGRLAIRARRIPDGLRAAADGHGYVSGLLTTRRSFAQRYGLFEIRAQLPEGRGLWPAFWLLPADETWPPELDVLEALGHDPTSLYVTAHSGVDIPDGRLSTQTGTRVTAPDLSAGFHVYGALWTPERIVWTLDGAPVFETETPADMHGPMFLVVNLAVGGIWPGAPDAHTRFPAALVVDWIRVRAMPEPPPVEALRAFP